MQTYEVRVTEFAEEALRGIGQYITYKLLNRDAAVNTLLAIREGIRQLSNNPQRIRLVEEEPWRTEGVRRQRVKNFYVYFWIDEDLLKVQVTHVVYVGRDQKRQMETMPRE